MRKPSPRRTLPALLAVALIAGPGAGSPSAAAERRIDSKRNGAQPSFSGTAEVVSVEVPVNVVDRDGKPVRGLTADDFVVYDQGQRQTLTGFEVVDLETTETQPTAAAAAPAPIASHARRHILLLFDLSFSTPTAVVKARMAARDFVLKSLHPLDLAAIATYSLQQGPRLVVTFTPDRAQLARGIDTLGAHTPDALTMAKRDPLHFVIAPADMASLAGESGLGVNSEVRSQQDQMVTEYMKSIAQQAERSERFYSEARINNFAHGLSELGRTLASVPGRKQIVYFSEGFESRLLLGNDPSSDESVEDTRNLTSGESWKTDSDTRFGNSQLQGALFRMLETFRRADCVVQAIDIGGLRAEVGEPGERSRGTGQEVLFHLAHETGGELFRNANDFQRQLSAVLRRTDLTYLLTFERSDLPHDGSYRRLRVELAKGAAGGARLSHRPGYYTPRPFKDLDPLEKSLLAGDGIASAVPRRDVEVSALVASFRSTPKLAYVPVVLEVAGSTLLDGHQADVLDTEIYAYASDAKGEMRDFFTHMVRIDLGRARRILEQTGLKYYGHLDLPPGDYRIRVLVRNAQTGRTGVESLPLKVPAYDAAQPYLLPPLFMTAQDGWMMVRERADEAGSSVVYPFTVKGEPYVPAARPVMAASGQASLCLVGYNLGSALAVDARVVGVDGVQAAGAAPRGGRVALVERTATGIQGLDKLIATFDPAGLSAGDYVLQVAVEDTTSGSRQHSSLPITIR